MPLLLLSTVVVLLIGHMWGRGWLVDRAVSVLLEVRGPLRSFAAFKKPQPYSQDVVILLCPVTWLAAL